jgi:hypothetical protein
MGTKTGYARNENIDCSKRIYPVATGRCDRTKSRSRLGGAEHWAALLCEQKFGPAAGRIGLCREKKKLVKKTDLRPVWPAMAKKP